MEVQFVFFAPISNSFIKIFFSSLHMVAILKSYMGGTCLTFFFSQTKNKQISFEKPASYIIQNVAKNPLAAEIFIF